MKAAGILVLGVARAAGGAASFFVGPGQEQGPRAPRVVQIETTDVPIAKSKTGTLWLALRSRIDTCSITADDAGRRTGSAPSALVSAATNDAS